MKQKISHWLNLTIEIWNAPLLSLWRLNLMNLSLVFLGVVSPLPFYPLLPSIFAPPCPLVHPLSLSFAGSKHLTPSSFFTAAWLPPRSAPHPVALDLMVSWPWVYGIYPSHVWSLVLLCPPLLPDSRMPPQISLPDLAGSHEIQRFLEQVVVGVSEGWLQGLPW